MIKLSGPFYELKSLETLMGNTLKQNTTLCFSLQYHRARRPVGFSLATKRLVNDVLHPNTQHIQMEGVPLSWWKFYS